jgi:hypothetical protein
MIPEKKKAGSQYGLVLLLTTMLENEIVGLHI